MTNSTEIKLVTSQNEFDAVARLRYDIYVGELGWSSRYADHQCRRLVDPLDAAANILGAYRGDELLGTVRTNYDRRGSGFGIYNSLYAITPLIQKHPGQVSITTMFAVKAPSRRTRVPLALAKAAFLRGLADDILLNVIDCEPGMIPFYSKLGYSIHRESITHPDYGSGTCMILKLRQDAVRFTSPEPPAASMQGVRSEHF